VHARYIGNDDGELVQCVNPGESGRVTDLHRIVRVVRKLETSPDARMGSNTRMGSEPQRAGFPAITAYAQVDTCLPAAA
jgi:hypothetical protein